MKLRRLSLRNYRRLADVDVEFPTGVVAIVGSNGAGKSTLLEAVGFALFGTEAARTGKDLLRHSGAAPSADVEVALWFEFGGEAYEVRRVLQGKSGTPSATVTVGGKVVVSPGANSGAAATEYVARRIGLDRQAFFTSVVARQRELAALTEATPAERKRILMRLLGIESVEEAIQRLRQDKRGLRMAVAQARGWLGDGDVLRAQSADAEVRRRANHEEQLRMAARLRDLQERERAAKSARDEADGALQRLREAEADHARLEERQRALERDGARLRRERDAAADARRRFDDLRPRLADLPAREAKLEASQRALAAGEERRRLDALAQAMRREVAAWEADAARLQREATEERRGAPDAAAVERDLDATRARRQHLAARVAAADAEFGALEAAHREHGQRLAHLEEAGEASPCPLCERPLREVFGALRGTLQRQRAEAAQARTALDARRATLLAQAEEATRRAADLEPALRRAREVAQRLALLEGKRADVAARAAARADELRGVEARLAELGPRAPDRDAHAALARDVATLRALAQEAARLEAAAGRVADLAEQEARVAAEVAAVAPRWTASRERLAGLEPARLASRGAREAWERAVETFQAALQQATRLEAQGQILEAEAQRLARDVREREERAAALREQEAELEALEALAGDRDAGLLPQFREHLVARVGPSLAHHASRLFARMTEGRYPGLDLDGDYEPQVFDRGARYPLERFSGGEVDLANLALRLAVSELVASKAGAALRFIALDEVFGSQDGARRTSILRALKELAPRFDQVFVVTHIDEVKESSDRVLTVRALDDGTSTLAWA